MRNKINALLMVRTHNMSTQFLRFLLAGGVVVLLDTGIFYLLSVSIGMHYLLANTVSFVVSMSLEYFISREWVFNHQQHQPTRDYLLFLLGSLFCLLISTVVLYVLMDLALLSSALPTFSHAEHLLIAKAFSIVLITLFDFWFKKTLVFGAKPERG